MNELEAARNEISRIDKEMAKLFEQRMHAAAAIAGYKKQHGLSVKDPVREKELIDRNRALIESADIESYYVQFLKKTIELSCEYQSKLLNGMKVTYCGVEGAFAHMAAKRMFPEAGLVPYSDFGDAYEAVERGEYDCAGESNNETGQPPVRAQRLVTPLTDGEHDAQRHDEQRRRQHPLQHRHKLQQHPKILSSKNPTQRAHSHSAPSQRVPPLSPPPKMRGFPGPPPQSQR